MRLKDQDNGDSEKYNIIVIDDDPGIIDTLKVIVNRDKYTVTGFTDPDEALKEMQNVRFDIMILDFLLERVTGKEVVEELRKFNNEIYIILLTGYKDKAPPIDALVEFDIQGYCEKSNRFDQLILQLESAVKSIILTRKLIKFHEGMNTIIGSAPSEYSFNPVNDVMVNILKQVLNITKSEDGYLISCKGGNFQNYEDVTFVKGVGKYDVDNKKLYATVIDHAAEPIKTLFQKREMMFDNRRIFLHLMNEYEEQSTALVIDSKTDGELQDIVKVFITNAQATYNNAILHTIVNKKNNDLHTMVNQLEENIAKQKSLEVELQQTQKMEVVGRLTGGIAHDFNNVLLIISGYSDVLLKKISKEDPNYDKVFQIKKAGDRATGLIKHLMAFSRKQNLNRTPFQINDIILSLKDMVDIILGQQIALVCDLYDHLWNALIDKTQMEQVIMNLIVNAKDAMPESGTITIICKNVPADVIKKLRKPEIDIKDYIQFSISDTGHGISPNILPNIFEPFFTTKNRGKGTGLGLSTVYGIVKQMDGYVYVESEVDKGTTFTIFLPRTDIIEMPQEEDVGKVLLEGSETILVVDDEDEIKLYVSSILKQAGYNVLFSNNPKRAIEIFKQHEIDLVLSDLIMPQMNGKQLIQKLIDIKPHTKFLFMSGYINSELIEHGFYYNMENFIEKPFSAESILVRIRKILDTENTSEAKDAVSN